MIDAEIDIFDYVSDKAQVEFPGIYMTGEYVKIPPSFPCVSLVEMDNAVYRESQTTSGRENHAAVMYELNIYSNKRKGKKAECKKIAAFIDDVLSDLNFTRIMLEPIPNMDDATIYRMLGRYRGDYIKKQSYF